MSGWVGSGRRMDDGGQFSGDRREGRGVDEPSGAVPELPVLAMVTS